MTPNDELACDECGRYGAIDLGERKLCPDCYALAGTCGAGGNGDGNDDDQEE